MQSRRVSAPVLFVIHAEENRAAHEEVEAERRRLTRQMLTASLGKHAAHLPDWLARADPAAVRQTLLGMVHQILADRHGKRLVAQVELFFDKKRETGYNPTVPIFHEPVGAPINRHSRKIEYTIQKQGNPQPVK